MMVVYIAGPMSGLPEFNRPAFHALAAKLEKEGFIVLSSARLPGALTEPQYMDIAFAMIRSANTVFFLPGWQQSDGARAEYHYAKKLGHRLLCAKTRQPLPDH